MPYVPTSMNRRRFLQSATATAMGSGMLLPGCLLPRDVIVVIGSGITGLCAGALLAKQGHRVRVLESHPELVGGHAASFEQDGFRFCVGPQYVWNFREDGIGMRVLRHLGLEDRVPFDSMDPDGFEEFRIGDEPGVAVPMGLDRFREAAMGAFPEDAAAFYRFFSYLADLHEGARLIDRHGLYTQGEGAMVLAFLLNCGLAQRVKLRVAQCMHWSLARLFDYCGLSQPARRFLYGHGGVFAENESAVSCMAYAAATGFYHAGADYPRFGFAGLIQALADCITDAGGAVETNKRVAWLERTGDRVARVVCADGEALAAGQVISTASPRVTRALLRKPRVLCACYTPSNSVISAFIGVHDYPGLPGLLAGKNIWWQDGLGEVEFRDSDMTQPPRLLAVASPSSNGLFNTNPDPQDHSLVVFAPGNYAQAAYAYAQSPEAHDDMRAQIAEQIMTGLEQHVFPDLGSYIRVFEVDTPYDLFTRTHGERGNAYGRRLTAGDLLTRPYTLLGIRNLHIACASSGMPGIATGFQTAVLLAQRLTGQAV